MEMRCTVYLKQLVSHQILTANFDIFISMDINHHQVVFYLHVGSEAMVCTGCIYS